MDQLKFLKYEDIRCQTILSSSLFIHIYMVCLERCILTSVLP